MPQSLLSAPIPLTLTQRKLLWLGSLLVVATSMFALSLTLWDWDEGQFAAGVGEYSVAQPYHAPSGPWPGAGHLLAILLVVAGISGDTRDLSLLFRYGWDLLR